MDKNKLRDYLRLETQIASVACDTSDRIEFSNWTSNYGALYRTMYNIYGSNLTAEMFYRVAYRLADKGELTA